MEYAVLMNPKAQTKAQEEIDHVIGADRLPTSEDEPKLPYVIALAKKVFQWQQVTPFGTRPFILHICGTDTPFLHLSDPPLLMDVTALPGRRWFSGTGTGSPVSAESGRVLHRS